MDNPIFCEYNSFTALEFRFWMVRFSMHQLSWLICSSLCTVNVIAYHHWNNFLPVSMHSFKGPLLYLMDVYWFHFYCGSSFILGPFISILSQFWKKKNWGLGLRFFFTGFMECCLLPVRLNSSQPMDILKVFKFCFCLCTIFDLYL